MCDVELANRGITHSEPIVLHVIIIILIKSFINEILRGNLVFYKIYVKSRIHIQSMLQFDRIRYFSSMYYELLSRCTSA